MAETTREKARRLRAPCSCCGHRRTLAEVARELGVSRQRVHQLIGDGAAQQAAEEELRYMATRKRLAREAGR